MQGKFLIVCDIIHVYTKAIKKETLEVKNGRKKEKNISQFYFDTDTVAFYRGSFFRKN